MRENVNRGYGVGFSVQSSSDPDVVEVLEPVSLCDADSYGPEPDENQDDTYLHAFIKVKALKPGTATITGTIDNGTGKITLKVKNEPNKTKIRKGKGGHGKCKLKWSKSRTAEGYEFMFPADDSNWKIKKCSVKKNASSSSFKIPDDYCYAKIRAYRILNGKKVYSKWSSLFVID